MKSKLLMLATSILLASAAIPSAEARTPYCWRGAVPYSYYQAPDGTYDSLADFVRDVRGIPCGINCTRAAMIRWARVVRCAG